MSGSECTCCCCRKKRPVQRVQLQRRLSVVDLENMSILPELSYELYEKYDYESYSRDLTLSTFFKVGEFLGRGQTSMVFQAVFLPTLETVAIKYFEDYRNERRSIMRELKVLKMTPVCRHLVRYHSHFRIGPRCYIIMECCSGINFYNFLDPHFNLPYTIIKIYMKQLASAIMFLHGRKIVHRDITLKNLLLDKSGNLRLADYGMSRTVADSSGIWFTDWGTLQYTAPEIFKDRQCSFPVDWWSAGVCLYRFITGGFPFATNNRRSYSYYIVKTHRVVYPPEFFTDPTITSLTKRLLQKKTEHRLGTNDDREIMRHPFFASDDWDKIDDVEQVMMKSSEEELLWYKDAFKNILSVLNTIFTKGRSSKQMKTWSRIEGLLYKSEGYRPRSDSTFRVQSSPV